MVVEVKADAAGGEDEVKTGAGSGEESKKGAGAGGARVEVKAGAAAGAGTELKTEGGVTAAGTVVGATEAEEDSGMGFKGER